MFSKALGDRFFYNGVIETSKLHSSASLENTYCFKFYYRGTESGSDFFPNSNGKNYGQQAFNEIQPKIYILIAEQNFLMCVIKGVCHGDDMMYVLKSYYGSKKTKNDLDMTKLLCSSIIAFMKNGYVHAFSFFC